MQDSTLVDALRSAPVGARVRFAEEKLAYTIQARSSRHLVCTKPFNPKRTVIYTIVDLEQMVRGTENLIFSAGFETREQCEEAVQRLSGSDEELGWTTEVSHRNRIPLVLQAVIPQT